MDLIKIAHSPEFSYLEKVATIVDEFAAGNIDGSTADAIAMDVGIDPEDLLSVYNLAYGEDGYEDYDMEKTAADESLKILEKVAADPEATYLDKVASVAYSYAAGALTGNEADDIAMNMGVDPSDLVDVFRIAYGDELDKEAGVIDAVKNFGGHLFGDITLIKLNELNQLDSVVHSKRAVFNGKNLDFENTVSYELNHDDKLVSIQSEEYQKYNTQVSFDQGLIASLKKEPHELSTWNLYKQINFLISFFLINFLSCFISISYPAISFIIPITSKSFIPLPLAIFTISFFTSFKSSLL